LLMFHVEQIVNRYVDNSARARAAAGLARPANHGKFWPLSVRDLPLPRSVEAGQMATTVVRFASSTADQAHRIMLARLKSWTQNLFRSTEPVPEPVPGGKLTDYPRACGEDAAPLARPLSGASEPVPITSEPVPEPVPKLTAPAEPFPLVHARALLELLRQECCEKFGRGSTMLAKASYVQTECYPRLLEERGWREQPWVGRHGVGKYLADLTGGKKSHNWDTEGGKKKRRVYRIAPAAETGAVVDLAAVRKRA
jgi:hypothetical protein